jgi:hypothetical protein
MKNVIILGTGRSGTSMAAGLFSAGDYYMGDQVNRPNKTNPKGQFEDADINKINEIILAKIVNSRPEGKIGQILFKHRPAYRQRWLSILKQPIEKANISKDIQGKIEYYASKAPFCYKDPRFSYTLLAWKPYIVNAKYLIIFRDPLTTVESMFRQKKLVNHLNDFNLTQRYLFRVWHCMYNNIIQNILPLIKTRDYIFFHYKQLFESKNLDRLDSFVEYKIDRSFPDNSLVKPHLWDTYAVPENILNLYKQLCWYAGYDLNS